VQDVHEFLAVVVSNRQDDARQRTSESGTAALPQPSPAKRSPFAAASSFLTTSPLSIPKQQHKQQQQEEAHESRFSQRMSSSSGVALNLAPSLPSSIASLFSSHRPSLDTPRAGSLDLPSAGSFFVNLSPSQSGRLTPHQEHAAAAAVAHAPKQVQGTPATAAAVGLHTPPQARNIARRSLDVGFTNGCPASLGASASSMARTSSDFAHNNSAGISHGLADFEILFSHGGEEGSIASSALAHRK
jgi:hypothetical protein